MYTDVSLEGQTAVITGASAGIGEACAAALAHEKVNLILCARREEKIRNLARQLEETYGVSVRPVVLDVRDRKAVEEFASQLSSEGLGIDILVNNAGLARGKDPLQSADMDDWDEMIDTNVKGLLYMTRGIAPLMLESSSAPVIINIGSIAGMQAYEGGGVYCATKAAVGMISDGLRIDTVSSAMRVCNIRPGLAETEFSLVRFHGDNDKAQKVYQDLEPLYAGDIADAVRYVCTRPPHVQISQLTIMPTHQASGSVVHRGD